ncbi:BZIP domain-containing protein [Fusarium keratoplasticum]|uniref:BZIP domain-containing protein n=1 Tax=Fusarium keratoplasticum TaxID=1328300 RepID=A0ACC0QRB7_9HYPO|nr:BZIP domain-containing protein [Fusarium keratoplasticum]KAI8665841.1 BZIP domain-containing protein [Fusarium keratoplasticum]
MTEEEREREKEEKKTRNRLSQQAFRRRTKEQIRELASLRNELQKEESERVKAYQRENRLLRQKLVQVQADLSRHLASIKSICNSVSATLDGTGDQVGEALEDAEGEEDDDREEYEEADEDVVPMTGPFSSTPTQGLSVSGPSSFTPQVFGPAPPLDSTPFTMQNAVPDAQCPTSAELVNGAGTSPFYAQLPGIWSHRYQMGPEPYFEAMSATQEASMILGKDFNWSNSPFSDHIQLLQRLLLSKLNGLGFAAGGQYPVQSIYQPVLMALSLFNSMTRPDVMAWYAKTRFYHIIELTAWQLFPSIATYNKLHPRYQPTPIQLEHQHPLVIDWIPFPALRDQLVQHHSANPDIDQIFCDAVTGYVVETPMASLVQGAPLATAYIRVTDLITAMDASMPGNDTDMATLPAPSVAMLFSSPAYARAAFRKLNMDKGAGYYKIDPAFFQKYPELRPGSGDLVAMGIPLKPKQQNILTYPKPLDPTTVQTYRSFIDFSIDAANTISSANIPAV